MHTNAQSSTIRKPTATNNTHQQVKWIKVDPGYKLWRAVTTHMKHMGSTGRHKGKACVFSRTTLVLGTKPGNPVKLNMFKHKTTGVHFHPCLPFHLLLLLMNVSYYTVLKDSRRENHNPVHLPTSQIFTTLTHKIRCMCRRSLHP